MKTLTEIGTACGTDKATFHGFTDIYPTYLEKFRGETGKLLEFGIAGGASLRMWHEYLPFFVIHGVDHTPACVDAMYGQEHLIAVHHGDVSHKEWWQWFENTWMKPGIISDLGMDKGHKDLFDIVIDDASHTVWAQSTAFILGWPILKPGGLWFIEDTHASWDPAYRRDNEPNGMPEAVTIMDVIFRECHRRLHEFGADQCGRQTTGDIEWVHTYKSLLVIKKR